ncbi:MAG TPA: TetR/AcrR family transcriptional regulator [Spirochaetota bacterium]|nr:TetR/AcrR family transcriptional regulator [Spirochaetota bacterium]HPJ35275.1 TetR/AcrR family transcriptional regulator [Spirochaetota bacterium]
MPPKKMISDEDIVQAAFELVRKKGLGNLTARNIAGVLSCSTQPVYYSFRNIKDIETAVISRIKDFVVETYLNNDEGNHQFFNIGKGYIRLARYDRELFSILFLSGRMKLDIEKENFPIANEAMIELMKKDSYLKGFEEFQLSRILKTMWFYTHGLATFVYTYPGQVSDDFLDNAVFEMGGRVIRSERVEAKRKKSEGI